MKSFQSSIEALANEKMKVMICIQTFLPLHAMVALILCYAMQHFSRGFF